jgi:hypothetical protein
MNPPVCDLVARFDRCRHEIARSNEHAVPILNNLRLI